MNALQTVDDIRPVAHNHLRITHRRNGKVLSDQVCRNLRTNAGANFQAQQMGGTPGAAANRIALTANSDAPAVTDTTLTGEITGDGLERATATFAHAGGGATTYTLTHTFTKTGGASVTLAKAGCFDAAVAGNMVFETLFADVATLVVGDEVTVQWSVNI